MKSRKKRPISSGRAQSDDCRRRYWLELDPRDLSGVMKMFHVFVWGMGPHIYQDS
ncbi:rCG58184 [Rattus norvegicus]|uniref:RCG58184 n=1 Tax=Rattus norvegicus TaxID=10116 RepID=A6J555_RAT|nr:rCG58184 [Rattus norvegicus]